MSQQNHLTGPALAVTALALMLAGCGSRNAQQLAGATVRPPGHSVIYVVNIPPGLIPVDVAHRRTSRPITLPTDATGVEVASDRRTAYVRVGSSLVPVDLRTRARRRPIGVPPGSSAYAIAPDGRTAYVLDGRSPIPIDLRTAMRGLRIIVPDLSADHFIIAAGGRAACLTGTTVTASGLGEHQVIEPIDLIDLASGEVGRSIRLPMMLGVGAIAITADGRTAYVGNLKPENKHDGIVVPIDLTTLRAEKPIRVPSYPYSITGIVIAPGGRTAYVAAYSAVIPIDLKAGRAGRPIPMPAGVQAVTLAP